MFSRISRRRLTALEVLSSSKPMIMTIGERAEMTISCKDSDYIPKVPKAGRVVRQGTKKVQIMHNGIKVLAGGYYGDLIETIISRLRGHHEPQEEKVFYEILKRITRKNPTMIEMGSFWAYYSLWFKAYTKEGVAICCEPDPKNILVGKENMRLNGFAEGGNLFFHQTAAGKDDGKTISFQQDSDQSKTVRVDIRTADSLIKEHNIDFLDILHLDVQGVELDALKGVKGLISAKRIRFVVVSTHHYIFSGDPTIHMKCEEFIVANGGHIIASHNIAESYSGDGLIVASFSDEDKGFKVQISHNNGRSLFRSPEEDLQLLISAYDYNKVIR